MQWKNISYSDICLFLHQLFRVGSQDQTSAHGRPRPSPNSWCRIVLLWKSRAAKNDRLNICTFCFCLPFFASSSFSSSRQGGVNQKEHRLRRQADRGFAHSLTRISRVTSRNRGFLLQQRRGQDPAQERSLHKQHFPWGSRRPSESRLSCAVSETPKMRSPRPPSLQSRLSLRAPEMEM